MASTPSKQPLSTPPPAPDRLARLLTIVIARLVRIDRKLGRVARRPDRRRADLLTIAGAAARTGLSQTTIRRAIHHSNPAHRLPAFNQALGNGRATWRIRRADLDAWAGRRNGGDSSPSAPPSPTPVRVPPGKGGQFKF